MKVLLHLGKNPIYLSGFSTQILTKMYHFVESADSSILSLHILSLFTWLSEKLLVPSLFSSYLAVYRIQEVVTFRFWRIALNNVHWSLDHFCISFQVEFPKCRRNGKTSSSFPFPYEAKINSDPFISAWTSFTSFVEALSPQTWRRNPITEVEVINIGSSIFLQKNILNSNTLTH